MSKQIKSVSYNGHQTGSNDIGFDFACDYAELGKSEHPTKRIVKSIIEHIPGNGLQQHLVDIEYEDGSSKRIFNICEINYQTAMSI